MTHVKRAIDIVLAAVAITVLAPLILFLSFAVFFSIGSPVFFRQLRAGLNGKPFQIYKFRSMSDQKDESGNLLPDNERMTTMGAFLRNTSLDELPQLLNILKGDMSIVGPRPLHVRYLERYTPVQARRHDVKPGLTGWAQVRGRNALTWEEKFALDVWYVDHRSLSLDLKILWMTVGKLLSRSGVAADDHATMPEYMGIAYEKGSHEIESVE